MTNKVIWVLAIYEPCLSSASLLGMTAISGGFHTKGVKAIFPRDHP